MLHFARMLGGQIDEDRTILAVPGEDGAVLVYSSTQHPSEVQHIVARVLGLPDSFVTCPVRRMGGGFGGKETQATQWAVIAALAARATGRPCKLRLDRDADMAMTGKRHVFFGSRRGSLHRGVDCRVRRRNHQLSSATAAPATAAATTSRSCRTTTAAAASPTTAAATRLRRALRRHVHVCAVLRENAHGVNVDRVRGAPERGRALEVLETAVGVAAIVEREVPRLLSRSAVRIRALASSSASMTSRYGASSGSAPPAAADSATSAPTAR